MSSKRAVGKGLDRTPRPKAKELVYALFPIVRLLNRFVEGQRNTKIIHCYDQLLHDGASLFWK